MSFDSNNNSPSTNGQTQSTSTPLNGNQPKKEPISPWEEDLPEEAPKTQQIGTLSNSTGDKEVPLKKDVSFVVPENIENQTALNIVEGSDFNSAPTKENKPTEPAIGSAADVEGMVRNGAMDLNLSSSEPGIVRPVPSQSPQLDVATTTEGEVKPNSDDYDDLDIFGDIDSSPKNIAQDIKPASVSHTSNPASVLPAQTQPANVSSSSTLTPPPATPTQSVQQQPAVSQTPPDLRGIIAPPPSNLSSVSSAQPTQAAATPPSSPIAQASSQVVAGAPLSPQKKSFLVNLSDKLKRKKSSTAVNFDQNQPKPVEIVSQNQALDASTKKQRFMLPLVVIGGIIAVFVIGILLTESGVFSFGFEKAYNALGLEVLWGGLPKSAEKSLGLSLFSMKNVTGFKVNGNIKLTINKDVESEVTSPLVSVITAKRYLAVKPEQAILAVSDTTTTTDETTDPATIYTDSTTSDSSSTDNSTTDTTSDTTNDSSQSSETASDQTSSMGATDQESDSSYQTYQSTSKDVAATIDGFISKDGSEMNLSVDKAGTSLIDLKNSAEKFWVQSDKIKFNSNAEDGKWLEYNISALQGKNLLENFFASDFSSVSVQGQKVGNEKIDNIRCYHYKIDSIELGESLSEIGISSGMAQSISGEIWVGIKDKMIRKLDLKITPSGNSAISDIEISLKLSSFDAPGRFSAPDSSSVIADLASFTSSIADSTSSEQTTSDAATSSDNSASTSSDTSTETTDTGTSTTVTNTVDLASQNDTTRKSDLQSIKSSLEAYKADHGKYPVSSVVAKLNLVSNILTQKLVSNYITALPKDPKDSEGWFYGYKSTDGKSFYLSARLENANDYSIKTVDNIPLYFVYNE